MTIRKWGGETLVNTTTSGFPADPVVTTLADGGYVIAWTDFGTTPDSVRFQIFNTDGTKRGNEIQAPTFGGNDVINPAIAPLADGGFVLTFDTELSNTDTDPCLLYTSPSPRDRG